MKSNALAFIRTACAAIGSAGVLLLVASGSGLYPLGAYANIVAIIATAAGVFVNLKLPSALTPSAAVKLALSAGAMICAALVGADAAGTINLGAAANWIGLAAVVIAGLGHTPFAPVAGDVQPAPTGIVPPASALLLAGLLGITAAGCPRVSNIPIVGPGVDCATAAVSGHIDLLTEITTVLTNPSVDAVIARLTTLANTYGPETIACWVDKVTGDSQVAAKAGNQNAALRARNGAEWLSRSQAGFARRVQ